MTEAERRLEAQLIEARDDERRRMARELHDTTGQHVCVMIMDLDLLAKQSTVFSPDARAALSECAALARQTLRELRTFSYLLQPPMLEELGVISALRIFVEGFSRRSRIQVAVEMPEIVPRMPKAWEIAAFQVVQEGLTNVHRHSTSSRAKVLMRLNTSEAIITVRNPGLGVPPLAAGGLEPTKVGVGIGGMRQRMTSFGGKVSLYSHAGWTILEASLPFPRIGIDQ